MLCALLPPKLWGLLQEVVLGTVIASVLLTGGILMVIGYFAHQKLERGWRRHAQDLQVSAAAAQQRLAEEHHMQLHRERDAANLAAAQAARAAQDRQLRLQQQIEDYHAKNVALAEQNEGLRDELSDLAGRCDQLRGVLDQVKRDSMILVRHTVFLDGMPRSGKTTFLERLVNPTATEDQLLAQESTANPYHSQPVPLCWEEVEGHRVLHALDFVDIAGERGAGMADMLDQYEERLGNLRVAGLPPPRAVALVLWDTSVSNEDNLRFLSPARIEVIYGARKARGTLRSILVFLNKFDAQARGPDVALPEERIALHKRVVQKEAFERVAEMYPPLSFTAGSALTGAGVHTCLGEIVRALDLGHCFSRPAADSRPALGQEAGLDRVRQRSRAIRFGARNT